MRTTPTSEDRAPGPLAGLRVVELAGEWSPLAGKLLAEMGADVVLVEPPGGHHTRHREPYLDDRPGPDRSLWWWAFHTSKRSIDLALAEPAGSGRLMSLLGSADVFLDSETPGELDAAGIDWDRVSSANPDLIWTSITPFGLEDPRSLEPVTDLTLMAGAGPVWMCGYDDHTLPPVRGEGCQAMSVASVHAVAATLSALLARGRQARGQRIDVSVHAALNVTTEGATYEWLTVGLTQFRQTGRHAAAAPTLPVQVMSPDGRWVTTGFPPRHLPEIVALNGWLSELGLEATPEGVLLDLAVAQGGVDYARLRTDPIQREMLGAGRDALTNIAKRLPAREFFVEAQRRGLAVGIINSPEMILEDPHMLERHAFMEVDYEELEAPVTYPPPPFRSVESPYRIRSRAPRVGANDSDSPIAP
jgi:benzylsuccinate CoA-transferase BbsE subunit